MAKLTLNDVRAVVDRANNDIDYPAGPVGSLNLRYSGGQIWIEFYGATVIHLMNDYSLQQYTRKELLAKLRKELRKHITGMRLWTKLKRHNDDTNG